ncbi:MAG: sugar phosphate nucleotidyltransferase [Desulfurococcaceae archaeon]
MKAIILAAGEGRRLRPITETRPKALLPVLCKPLLHWHLMFLEKIGIKEAIIVTHYLSDKILKYVEKSNSAVKAEIVYQKQLLGTADAVVKAAEHIGYGEDVVILYSDIFFSEVAMNTLSASINTKYPVIAGAIVDNPREYGALILRDHHLDRIIEKPIDPITNLVNAGIYKLNTTDILENQDIKPSPRGEFEFTDIVNKIAGYRDIKTIILPRGSWIDIGKPWDLINANKIALQDMKGDIKGNIIEPVSIKVNVHIEEGAVIYPFTTINGPAFIGKNAQIGPNALIRPWSVICDNSKIGFSVEVKESIVFENVHASHLAYIGDSIICENVNLGAGTIIANLRFDEKTVKMMIDNKLVDSGRRKLGAVIGAGVKTGINVSIMPGVKIGSNSWIMPGTVVYRDVPSNTIYPGKLNQ